MPRAAAAAAIMIVLLIPPVLAGGHAAPEEVLSFRVTVAAGDTIAVTQHGAGSDVVVIVPGLLGNGYGYRAIAPAFAGSGYRVLIVEPLGTGASSKPRRADYTLEAQALRLIQVLDTLTVVRAHLVCHSMSGSICLRLALRAPSRVSSIVSINGGADERGASPGLKSALRFAPLLKLIGGKRMVRGKVRDGLRNASGDPSWVSDTAVAGYTAPFDDLTAILRSLNAIADAVDTDSLQPRLPHVRAPVLLLIGASSRNTAVPPEMIERMASGLPDFAVDSIAGAGQYIHEEQPAIVIERIRAFLQRHSAREVTPVPSRAR